MQHIAVLMGGLSSEREVSLVSGKAVVEALETLGKYRVTAVDVQKDIAQKLAELKPDVAFNALHGSYGEDGCIQGVLEILGIPYTHSGVLAGALAMDKPMAKYLFESAGLSCPPGKELDYTTLAEMLRRGEDPMSRPYVIKPSAEGSSVGVILVKQGDNLPYEARLLGGCTRFLVESYIPGRELSVAVLENEALGVVELRPQQGFYDYANKYTDGKTEHLLPAPIPPFVYSRAQDIAVQAHHVLGCRGLSRADFRYDDSKDGISGLYLLEVNTHPGFTPLSLAPEMAKHKGISFPELCERLIQLARCDH